MTAPTMAASPTIQAVDTWVRQGLELRQKLETEQSQLKARLAEIERALEELPEAPLNPEEAPGSESDASTPKRVIVVLQEATEPMTASAVIEKIQKEIKIDPMLIHSALYRLAKRGEIIAEGSKGKKTYRWEPPPPPPPPQLEPKNPDDIPF